jgi:hypothetical protein
MGTPMTILRLRPRPLLLAIGLVGVVGLSAVAEAQSGRVRVSLPGHPDILLLDTLVVVRELEAPETRAYRAVVRAFEEMGIRPDTRDSTGGIVGALRLTRTGRLSGAPLSRYLNCGDGMTGANADTYRVRMAAVALLERVAESRTRVAVALAAGAEDMTGSGRRVPCTSTRRLEARLLERVVEGVGAGGT